jgi:hypothetical protein
MLAAVSTQSTKYRKPLTGPAMKDLLANVAGIKAPQVVRTRATGNYVANVFVPGLNEPVEPADVLTAKLMRAFNGVKIVETGETRADWRKDNPVVMVGITFTADQIEPKPQQPVSEPSPFFALSCDFYHETHEPARI